MLEIIGKKIKPEDKIILTEIENPSEDLDSSNPRIGQEGSHCFYYFSRDENRLILR